MRYTRRSLALVAAAITTEIRGHRRHPAWRDQEIQRTCQRDEHVPRPPTGDGQTVDADDQPETCVMSASTRLGIIRLTGTGRGSHGHRPVAYRRPEASVWNRPHDASTLGLAHRRDGFRRSGLVAELLARGHRVLCVVRAASRLQPATDWRTPSRPGAAMRTARWKRADSR